MKREILDLMDLWAWATLTGGSFKITRFTSDELLADVSVDEFYRSHNDIQFMGVTASELPDGLEYMVPSRRYTDPTERHKRYAKYIDPEKKPKGFLRCVEWALIVLSSRVGAKADAAIRAHTKGK
jgi:hypothetical protein